MPKKNSLPKNRIQSLDGCRGILALMVVLYHANNNTILTNNFFVRQSYLFVDYFFVLSGFVLCYNYAEKIKDIRTFRDFFLKRLIRLYPLLLYTTFIFGIILFLGKYLNLVKSKETYKGLLLQGLDTLTLMNSTPILGKSLGINYPSWSISAEIIASTFFGLGMLIFKKNAFYFFGACLIILILFFFKMEHYVFDGNYGFVRGIFCFLLGYFLFLFLQNDVLSNITFGTFSEIFSLIFLIVMFKIANLWSNQLSFIVFPFIFSIGIYLFAKGNGLVTHTLNSSISQTIGKLSFSIYLNHALVLIIFERLLFSNFKLIKNSISANITYLLLSVGSTIIYSYYTQKLIEVGVAKKLKKVFRIK